MHGHILFLYHEFGVSGLQILGLRRWYTLDNLRFDHGSVDDDSFGSRVEIVGVLPSNLTALLRLDTGYNRGVIKSAFVLFGTGAEKVFAHLHFSNRWRLELLLLNVLFLQRVLVGLRIGAGHRQFLFFLLAHVDRVLVGRSSLGLFIFLHFLGIILARPFIKFLLAVLSRPRLRINLIRTIDVPLPRWHALTELHISLEAIIFTDKHLFFHFPGYGLRVTEEWQRFSLSHLIILLIRLLLRFSSHWIWTFSLLSHFLLILFFDTLLFIWIVVWIELDFDFVFYGLQIYFSKWQTLFLIVDLFFYYFDENWLISKNAFVQGPLDFLGLH